MTKNIVAIPSRDRDDLLKRLLFALALDDGITSIIVMDNGLTEEAREEVDAIADHIVVADCREMGIYAMWNFAWLCSVGIESADTLTILNDDVLLLPHSIKKMGYNLCSSNYWVMSPNIERPLSEGFGFNTTRGVTGTYKDGGMLGFAFMMNMRYFQDLPFDEDYYWWYGDDDFVNNVAKDGGKVGILEGIPIEHEQSATGNLHPEILNHIGEDQSLYKKKWG